VKEAREYFPSDPISISFPISGSGSTSFQLVNSTSGVQTYMIATSQVVFVRRGPSDVGPATSSDFKINPSVNLFLDIPPSEGVRVLANSTAGVIYFGAVSK
jgi:hypothetical protein